MLNKNISALNDKIKTVPMHEVIVCVHNAVADVEKCLRSILLYRDNINKVIIVNDASNKETRDFLMNLKKTSNGFFCVIENKERLGYTKSANIGLSFSTASVVTLLNSDTIVTPSWSKKIIMHFKQYKALGILGTLSNAASYQSVPNIKSTTKQTAINEIPPHLTIDSISNFCEENSCLLDMPLVPIVHGFCFSISSFCLKKVGFFDEKSFPMGYGEETDYCIRAQLAGFCLGIALNIYIYHSKTKSYDNIEREHLSDAGWNTLISKYGKRRLSRYIKIMENHPQLAKTRYCIQKKLYENKIVHKSFKQFTPRGEFYGAINKTKAIAFYLPQFHPIYENNINWGDGFTEWTNVVAAKPRFKDHFQPRLPGELGFYDLRLPTIMSDQAVLASNYSISGFCFYYYRFSDKRVLETPLNNYMANRDTNFPFCYCWANESWTRAWDGKTSDILLEQTYDKHTINGVINDFASAILDDRYICINGRPLVLIYQIAQLENSHDIIRKIRKDLNVYTGTCPLIGTVYSNELTIDLLKLVDFVIQFPPHRLPRTERRKLIPSQDISPYDKSKSDYYESYDDVIKASTSGCNLIDTMLPGICPDWDNSPRRHNNSTILIGSTPEKFYHWVLEAKALAQKKFELNKTIYPLLFVNAWNEWAEGAFLEPSQKYGRSYLEAFKKGMK